MAIYLGNSGKLKLSINHNVWRLVIPSSSSSLPIVNGVLLKSFDNYILKDSNGVYLTAKEDK
jgi:hypothetical protein